jgi:hypothetical protein
MKFSMTGQENSHLSIWLSKICIQTSYDQNVQLILKSYLPVVYGITLNIVFENMEFVLFQIKNFRQEGI